MIVQSDDLMPVSGKRQHADCYLAQQEMASAKDRYRYSLAKRRIVDGGWVLE